MSAVSISNNNTKWWLGMVIWAVCSTATTVLWVNNKIESAIKIGIEDHRLKELHALHPSKDAFDSVQRDITEVRRSQEKLVESMQHQNQLLTRVAEKVGVGR